MTPREKALYEKAKAQLDEVYKDSEIVRTEFQELIAQMAAQILAEGQSQA